MSDKMPTKRVECRCRVGTVIAAICVLGACSLQDFDRLERGSAASPGGFAGTTTKGSNDPGTTTGGHAVLSGGYAGKVVEATAGSVAMGGSTKASVATTTQAGGGSLATAGSAGSAGTAGANNAGAMSCGGPMAISTVDPTTPASGLAAVTVPLKAVGQGTRVNYQDYTSVGSFNLTCASMTVVACAPDALGGDLHIYFTTTKRVDSVAFNVPLSALTSGCQSITVPVPDKDAGGFDPADIMVIRLEVEAASEFGTSWQTPATVVYIDSIKTSNGLFYDTFDGSTNRLMTSGARMLDGSSITWLRELPLRTGTGGTTSVGEAGSSSAGASNSAGNNGLNAGGGGASASNGQAGANPMGGTAGSRG